MPGLPRFEPKNPDYRAVAAATFDRQPAMQSLGISIARLEPGEVDLAMPYSPALTQQNGFIHAGSSPRRWIPAAASQPSR
jgi:acyl-coenzyme A thioesterase PaaI-like protein